VEIYKNLPRFDVLCVDMKSFYASVEAVSLGLDPLQAYVCVVGDLSRSGSIVLAASPKMKKEFGIKTGSRLYDIPRGGVPFIHVVEARMGYYLENSMHITNILNRFAPAESIHVYSVDEAWINVTNGKLLFGDPWTVAKQIQKLIMLETGLPCSVGIGDNKFLSKVILDVEAKKAPEGIAECRYEDVILKLHHVPIKEIWGIGSRMERNLNRLGIFVLGDIAKYPLDILKKRFGVMGEQLYWHSHGIDLSPVDQHPEFNDSTHEFAQKGFSMGITLLRDYNDREEIQTVILELSEEVARRARHAQKNGRTVNLGVGYSRDEFGGGFSKSLTMDYPTNITRKIYQTCLDIFKKNYNGSTVRNLYVSLTNLCDDSVVQLDIFEDVGKEKDIGSVMDAIRMKYGSTSLLRARSYTHGGIMLDRASKIGGHKK
jgi:DNA polymerase V